MDMYTIEMWVEDGYWSVRRWGDKGHKDPRFRRTCYEYSPGKGRWVALGGNYALEADADEQIARFRVSGSGEKPKAFRVVYPMRRR